jgi:hypothetical protein
MATPARAVPMLHSALFQPVTSTSISRTNCHRKQGNHLRSPKEVGTTTPGGLTDSTSQGTSSKAFAFLHRATTSSLLPENNACWTVGAMEGAVGPWYLVLKLRLVPRSITTHQSREADPPPPPHPVSGIHAPDGISAGVLQPCRAAVQRSRRPWLETDGNAS